MAGRLGLIRLFTKVIFIFYHKEAFQAVCPGIWQLCSPHITVDWDSLLKLKERRPEVINLSGPDGLTGELQSERASRGSRETRSLHLVLSQWWSLSLSV